MDLSGEALKKNVFDGVSAGLEWTPVVSFYQRGQSKGILGSAEAGPQLRLVPFGVPVKLHAGGAARSWDDNILTRLGDVRYGDFSRDNGYYAGAEFGNPLQPVRSLPLYVNFKGYGRSMSASNLIAGTASALWYHAIRNGDSLFVVYADSLINGKDAYLGQVQGKPRLINDPLKEERSMQVSAGYKGKTRYFLWPGAVYSYGRHTVSFPSQGLWGDRKNTDQSINFILQTDTSFRVTYKGGFRVDWENEDKLYDKNVPAFLTQSNMDSLEANLQDYTGYRVAMVNFLSYYFKSGIGIEYTSDVSRYSKEYPNTYLIPNPAAQTDSVRRYGLDNDIIVNRQRIAVTPVPSSWVGSSLFFETSTNLTNYVKHENSKINTIDWLYRIGTTVSCNVFDRCTVSEAMSADVRETRYKFPEVNKGNPPPYARKWSSLLLLNSPLYRSLTCRLEWKESYNDHGTWNSIEYLDDAALSDTALMAHFHEYYAIEEKWWQHGIRTSVSLHFMNNSVASAGIYYHYSDTRDYDAGRHAYVLSDLAGSQVEPFVSLEFHPNSEIVLKSAIAYMFDKQGNYWDITISLIGVF
jgi:hypothetical protein